MINQAIKFAYDSHYNQKRKGTDFPYVFHPLEAMIIVSRITSDKDIICAAVLHDVIEDCGATPSQLCEIFGKNVADLVVSVSDDKALPWKQRKEKMIDFLKSAPDATKIIELGDKLSNLRSINSDLIRFGNAVWDKFPNRNIDELAWYYTELAKSIETLKNHSEYMEMRHLIASVFKGKTL